MPTGRKIVHVASFGNPSAGSFIPNIVEISRRSIERGATFTFITTDVPGATWHDTVRGGGANIVAVRSSAQAYEATVRERADVVHVHFTGYMLPATLAAWSRSTNVFWHVHTALPPRTVLSQIKAFARFSLLGRRASRFIAVSHALAAELEAWRIGRGKTTVIANAIDTARYREPVEHERRAARERLGIEPGERAVLFFGRDTHVKGADVLAEALGGDVAPLVIAVGMQPGAAAALDRRTRAIHVGRTDDVRALYWAADALVMPSRMESAGYVLMEAMSCGLPALASDIPALRETATGVASVHFAEAGNAAALRAGLRSLAEGARRPLPPQVRARFGLSRWADEVWSLYE